MIEIVMGGQYGSEGKGSVVSWLVEQNQYDLVIRTGGSQAGHTFCYKGETHKMRMIPCAWHTKSQLALSRQAVVNEGVLLYEIEVISKVLGILPKDVPLFIHPSATLLTEDNVETEKMLQLGVKLGSTLEGVGAARAGRIFRKAPTVGNSKILSPWVRDYSKIVANPSSRILIESTQGWGLSLFGDHYPFVTSADITPYSILADAGIPFGLHSVKVFGVLRTFPIRVGGNSGELDRETTWALLRDRFGDHIPNEYTTVTGRERRVGYFEFLKVQKFISECHPDEVFLTFCDYPCPELLNITSGVVTPQTLPPFLVDFHALIPHTKYLGIGIGKFLKFQNQEG